MKEENYLIRTALARPDLLGTLLYAGNLVIDNQETRQKLEKIYKYYKKNKELPSLNKISKYIDPADKEAFEDLDKVTESDVDWFYEEISSITKSLFISELDTKYFDKNFEFSEIKKLYKDTVVEFDEKVETHKHISSSEDILSLLKDFENQDDRYINTGYRALNSVLKNSGWKPGSTYCVMGLTGTGKSIFLTNFAARLLEEYNVLFITTEMGHLDTYERILYSYFDCGSKEEIAYKLKRMPEQYPIHNIDVYKVHPNDTTTDDIANIIDELDWKPDAIIIDYIDEIKGSEKVNNEYEKHGVVSADIKKLAEVQDCPVITATQTNRSAEGEYGGTKDWVGMNAISDSQKKVRTLDVLFSIVQNPQEKEDGKISLITLKNRFGVVGQYIEFNINYKHWRISDDIIIQKRKEEPESDTKKRRYKDYDEEEWKEKAKKQGMRTL